MEMKKVIKIPPIVFKIVWPILYTFLLFFVISIYQQSKSKTRTQIIYTFWIGIALNIFWILLYFAFKQKTWAFVDLILMVIVALYTLKLLYPPKSVFLFYGFLVYTLWIIFALVLTILNKNKN